MTIHKISAGDGYEYYTRQVASGDVHRQAGQNLDDYYEASGTPAGVWMGSGIAALGVSGTVTEAQMRALFGQGLHPNADQIIADAVASGATHEQAVRQARLGRRYYQFDEDCGPLSARIQQALAKAEKQLQRPVTDDERQEIRQRIGAEAFLEDFGRAPRDDEELKTYIRALTGSNRQAVAGWDLGFAPEPGIQEAWALGTKETRLQIEAAHEVAIAETLAWLEENALATRTGANGIAQEDVQGGLIAARFRHWDSRLGDPLLHDHVVVSNKVRGLDGTWRTLDGRLLYAMSVAASELYNQRVIEEVCRRFGLRAEERIVTPGRRPVLTIAGVDHDLMRTHSKRSRKIRERAQSLSDAYRRKHGREPDTAALIALAQRATLETRPRKKKARSLKELRAAWRAEAISIHGRELVDGLLDAARAAAGALKSGVVSPSVINVAAVAEAVVSVVSEERSVWGRRHLLAEARRQVTQLTGGREPAGDLPELIAQHALAVESLSITPPELHRPFAPLLRSDGSSVYRRREHELYTSQEVLAAEQRILNGARLDVIPAVTRRRFAQVADRFPGPALDAGQRRLAAEFACSERLVVAGIGPAGAGKTTALALVAQSVTESGGRMIALAPSARAAKVLEQDLGGILERGADCTAHTVHSWLHQRARVAAGDKVDEMFALRPGDVLVVDEAGMAGTRRLARVVEEAEAAGAVVRLIGDPCQLAAVESGGALRLVAREVGAVELESLYRFRTVGEAHATLRLRDGEPADAWTWYFEHGRVAGGAYQEMADAVFAAWQGDTVAGRRALMTADSAEAVADLNLRAQAFQLAAGRLDPARVIPLRGGVEALAGDVIVTRANERRLPVLGGKDWVKNGDLWQVEYLFPDGSVAVRNTVHGGGVVLPADYVRDHAELGYASTVHRVQGMTVDRAHALVTRRTGRGAAYAALTRGRESNYVYAVCELGELLGEVLEAIAANERPSLSAHEEIRRAQERSAGLGQLVAEYADVHARATTQRIHAVARKALGSAAESFIGADRWKAVEDALVAAEAHGWQADRLLRQAYIERTVASGSGQDPAALLADRIEEITAEGERAASAVRPLARLSAAQLESLAGLAQRARRRALDEVCRADAAASALPRAVRIGSERVPAWPERQHGSLTGSQLAAALTSARSRMRRPELGASADQVVEYARTYASLRRELRTRQAMRWVDRAREDWQREPRGADHPPRVRARMALEETPARQKAARRALRRAEAVTARIRAEQALRRRLPHGPAVPPHDRGLLPDWVADSTAVRSPDTPMGWRRHLQERRAVLDSRLRITGALLAGAPPAWCAPLGPPPPQGSALRPVWEGTAALVLLWRGRHALPDRIPGIGPRPGVRREAAAWDALRERIGNLVRASRASGAPGHQDSPSSPPTAGQQAAPVTHALRTPPGGFVLPAGWDAASALPSPGGVSAVHQAVLAVAQMVSRAEQDLDVSVETDTEVRAAAEDLADRALEAVVSGQELEEAWIGELPVPDLQDPAQQDQWRQLVVELAVYRMLREITTLAPLGEPPGEGEDRSGWDAVHGALEEFQRARVEQRLAHMRERRDADRAQRGITVSMPHESSPVGRRSGQVEQQQQHRPSTPGTPGRGRHT